MNIKNTDVIKITGQITKNNKQKLIKVLDSSNRTLGSQLTDDSGKFNIEITPDGAFDISKIEVCDMGNLLDDLIEFNTIVSKNTILTVITPPSNVTYGDEFNITANLKTTLNENIEGAFVELLVGDTVVDTKETNDNGNVIFTRVPVSIGNHSFTLRYKGDDYYNKSNSTINIIVGKETSIMNINSPSINSAWYSDKGIFIKGELVDNDNPNIPIKRKNISVTCGDVNKTLITDDNGNFNGYINSEIGNHSVTIEFEDENYSGNLETINNISIVQPILTGTKNKISLENRGRSILTATFSQKGEEVKLYNSSDDSLIGEMTDNSDGTYTYVYNATAAGDISLYAKYNDFLTSTFDMHDYLIYWIYTPTFTTNNPTPTKRLDSGYWVSQSNGELTLIGGCISDGWSNEGLWECDYDVKWNGTRYQWFRTLMALPNTILMGGWEGCLASSTSALGSNVQRDNNDCLTVVHQNIWDNPSTPWIHINIKKTTPTTLVVTKTGDTANNGTVTFTNCDLLDSYERMTVGVTSNSGSVIGKPTFKNFKVKRIDD